MNPTRTREHRVVSEAAADRKQLEARARHGVSAQEIKSDLLGMGPGIGDF